MNNSIRIAICEDDQSDAAYLRKLIRECMEKAKITLYASGTSFLASQPAQRFDLVFFDIYMEGMDGIATATAFRENDEECGIVFTTISSSHMPEAFDVNAEQYLIKPVEKSKLERVMRRRLRTLSRKEKTCLISAKGRVLELSLNDIIYVEVYDHNCLVHTPNDTIDMGTSMRIDTFAQLLPEPQFLRCHKSYIVNMHYVESIDRDFKMKNGHIVYIRRGDVSKCAKALDLWRLYDAGRDEDEWLSEKSY